MTGPNASDGEKPMSLRRRFGGSEGNARGKKEK